MVLSDSRYTNKDISLIYLDHLILHTNAGLNKFPKVLLIDRRGSYIDPEFIIKAETHNIHPYSFPGHLTYVLQPLDAGVFQPYKHWHKKAVQYAIRNFDLNYNIVSFIHDVYEITSKTCKRGTIQSVFTKAGMWPVSCKPVIEKIKIYPPLENLEPNLLTIPRRPTLF